MKYRPTSAPPTSATDETLERIYLGRRFKNDTERLEKLFALYTEMTAWPPAASPESNPARKPVS